ncbi:MAG: YfiR family protein [Bacteroidota bacterium]|nr:YfiR family protein [Candidatus Kapabacteria bacterium]MDW8220649.1 YfiR family protein [Bacteroidota bacterium]
MCRQASIWSGVLVGAVCWLSVLSEHVGYAEETVYRLKEVEEVEQIQAEEEKIIAAFIWQFLQFIEFPVSQDPFIVGFMGNSRVESFFVDIARQKRLVNGQAIEVRRIQSLDEIGRCQVLFIAPTESWRLSQIFARTKGRSILTIGRDSDFLLRGGMMNFYIENARVRFEYNTEELASGKLRCSSQLLRHGRQYSKAKE